MARDPGELYEVEPDAPETDDIVLVQVSSKDGKTVKVAVDFKGNVVSQ